MSTDYAKLSLPELDKHFTLRLGNLETELGELCKIIVAEEAKGRVRPECQKHAMMKWAHEINKGELHPRFVFVFASFTTAIESARGLVLAEQLRLASNGSLNLALIQDGKPIKVRKRLLDMTAEETRQALNDGKVRSYSQQVGIAEARHARAKQRERTTREKFSTDPRAVTIQFFGNDPVVPGATVARALQQLGGYRIEPITKEAKAALAAHVVN